MTFLEDWIESLKGLLPPRPPFLPAPPWEVPEVPEKPPVVPPVIEPPYEPPVVPPVYPPEYPPEYPPAPPPPIVPPVVPVEVEGYWELDYTIPRNGHHYACFANLYKRDKSVGGRRAGDTAIFNMNVRWITNNVTGVTTTTTARKWNGPAKGWLTDMGIREYLPDRYDAPITPPIDTGFFPDSDYDWVWTGYWEGAPYSGGYAFSGGHMYYPSSPEGKYGLMIAGKRVRFIRKYRLTETANGISVRIYVSGPPPGPLVETYFHRVNWLGKAGTQRARATYHPVSKMEPGKLLLKAIPLRRGIDVLLQYRLLGLPFVYVRWVYLEVKDEKGKLYDRREVRPPGLPPGPLSVHLPFSMFRFTGVPQGVYYLTSRASVLPLRLPGLLEVSSDTVKVYVPG